MRIFHNFKPILWAIIFAIGGLSTVSNQYADSKCKKKTESNACFVKHVITLQLADSLGFPVAGTEFDVTITIVKIGCVVTVYLPTINFQTGPSDNTSEELAGVSPLLPGGYIFTSGKFLPEEFRPTDLMPIAVVGASNNGLSEGFTYQQDPSTLPNPPVGYIVQVTNAGEINIQGAGTFGNIIAPGNQILFPTSISYVIDQNAQLCNNITVSNGATDVTQFTGGVAFDSIRDFHVCDAYNGTVVYAWTDNSMIPDKTIRTLNLMVAVGKTDANGNLIMGAPVQLTDFSPNTIAWDTAVAINRTNPDNIIVSYGYLDRNAFVFQPARAVSFDGGQTWPAPFPGLAFEGSITGNTLTVTQVIVGTIEIGTTLIAELLFLPDTLLPNTVITGPITVNPDGTGTYQLNNVQNVPLTTFTATTLQPNGPIAIVSPFADGFGDCRGVQSDTVGNIWYSCTEFLSPVSDFNNTPVFAVSTDQGVTYTRVFTAPPLPNPSADFYDHPQYTFMGDLGLGTYGLVYQTTIIDQPSPAVSADFTPSWGFLPIFGLYPNVGAPQFVILPQFTNKMFQGLPAASKDGRIWFQGISFTQSDAPTMPYTYITPRVVGFKSPGDLDENWAGPWHVRLVNNSGTGYFTEGITSTISSPVFGFFPTSQRSMVYDERRQALYIIVSGQTPDYSQNMRLTFIISRDNGLTWSNPIDISTTAFANRGFQSMALDEVTGNLVVGWYDGRNYPTFQSLEYMAAVIPAATLDCLVNSIPLTNPLFSIPAVDETPAPQVLQRQSCKARDLENAEGMKQKIIERRKLS